MKVKQHIRKRRGRLTSPAASKLLLFSQLENPRLSKTHRAPPPIFFQNGWIRKQFKILLFIRQHFIISLHKHRRLYTVMATVANMPSRLKSWFLSLCLSFTVKRLKSNVIPVLFFCIFVVVFMPLHIKKIIYILTG